MRPKPIDLGIDASLSAILTHNVQIDGARRERALELLGAAVGDRKEEGTRGIPAMTGVTRYSSMSRSAKACIGKNRILLRFHEDTQGIRSSPWTKVSACSLDVLGHQGEDPA
jgi:hypothetical protein